MNEAHITKRRFSPHRYGRLNRTPELSYPVRRDSTLSPGRNRLSTPLTRVKLRSKILDDSDSDVLITEKLRNLHSSFDDRKQRSGIKPGEIFKLRKLRMQSPLPYVTPTLRATDRERLRQLELENQ